MSVIEITCPSCNETFSADQALKNHLKNIFEPKGKFDP